MNLCTGDACQACFLVICPSYASNSVFGTACLGVVMGTIPLPRYLERRIC